MTTPRRRGKIPGQEQQARQGQEAEPIAVPLRWADNDVRDFVFANQIFARYAGGAYWLTFGQIHVPYEAKLDADRLRKEGVVVRPIAKIAVTPEILADFLEKLNGLYDRMTRGQTPTAGSAQ